MKFANFIGIDTNKLIKYDMGMYCGLGDLLLKNNFKDYGTYFIAEFDFLSKTEYSIINQCLLDGYKVTLGIDKYNYNVILKDNKITNELITELPTAPVGTNTDKISVKVSKLGTAIEDNGEFVYGNDKVKVFKGSDNQIAISMYDSFNKNKITSEFTEVFKNTEVSYNFYLLNTADVINSLQDEKDYKHIIFELGYELFISLFGDFEHTYKIISDIILSNANLFPQSESTIISKIADIKSNDTNSYNKMTEYINSQINKNDEHYYSKLNKAKPYVLLDERQLLNKGSILNTLYYKEMLDTVSYNRLSFTEWYLKQLISTITYNSNTILDVVKVLLVNE